MCKNYFSPLEQKTKSCTHFPIFHRFLCSKQLVFMSWNKNKQKILYLCWLSSSLYNISLYFMFSWNAFFCRCRCKASKSYKCFCSCYVLWCIQINLPKNFFGIELSILNEFFDLNFDFISRLNLIIAFKR